MIKVAINGFGRIGRHAAKIILDHYADSIELVAINDLTDNKTLAYLLQYDSIYGKYNKDVSASNDSIRVGDHQIKALAEKEISKLPWRDLGIDVVIESTGVFTKGEEAVRHVEEAGAKAVVISAPSKGDNPAPTYLRGVNEKQEGSYEAAINNASCTTNAIAPTIRVLQNEFGVEKALMTTVHSYTATQKLVDAPDAKDLRRGRAAGINIVPSTTGAAIATTEAISELKGLFDGVALRVPVPTGSIADITAVLKRDVSVEEVNNAFKKAAEEPHFAGILTVTEDPVVSSDIVGNPHSAIVDLGLTQVIGNLVKVFSWYDNEYGYSHRLIEMVERVGKQVKLGG